MKQYVYNDKLNDDFKDIQDAIIELDSTSWSELDPVTNSNDTIADLADWQTPQYVVVVESRKLELICFFNFQEKCD